jgi:hypothetical protein
MIETDMLPKCLKVVEKNWSDYRDEFEHDGDIATNPLLKTNGRFSFFCREYSVGRTIRSGTHDQFRETLRNSPRFKEVIQDGTGRALDVFEGEVRKDFGTHEPPRRIISVLSKVAAFLRSERFLAWDRFAKKGVNKVLGRRNSSPFNSYADYLAACDEVWNSGAKEQIAGFLETTQVSESVRAELGFQRRILDVYLMHRGDRSKW